MAKPSSKNKKTSLQKVSQLLYPSSPLKGLILFAILFAIIGGGYAAYKTFAATVRNVAYYQEMDGGGSGSRIVADTINGHQRNVWQMGGYDQLKGHLYLPYLNKYTSNRLTHFTVCAYLKTATAGVIAFGVGGYPTDPVFLRVANPVNVVGDSAYHNYCSSFVYDPSYTRDGLQPAIVNPRSGANINLNVYRIVLGYDSAAVNCYGSYYVSGCYASQGAASEDENL